MKVTFLGLGAMGQRMATRLLDAGHEVTVWNRNAAVRDGFDTRAAKAATPAEAVAAAEVVFAMLRDDAAATDVWLGAAGALAALPADAVAVECSTLSLTQVQKLHAAAAERDVSFVDAPVAGSRPQAEAGQLIFLPGGAAEVIATLDPLFAVMGGKRLHCGPAGAGAMAKLVVNAMFGTQLAALAELMAATRAQGFDAQSVLKALADTPVCSPAAAGAGGAMLAGQWAPAFPIDLVAKDFTYVAQSGTVMPVAEQVAEVYAQAVAEGFGADNITGIIQRYDGAARG